MKSGRERATQSDRDPDVSAAGTALQRAARRARERAGRVAESAPERLTNAPSVARNTETRRGPVDHARQSFSQTQGYEDVPGPLKLEELPPEARTKIWNRVFDHISRFKKSDDLDWLDGSPWIASPWREILKAKHCDHDHESLDEWDPEFSKIRRRLREEIETRPFNKVFDLIEFILRHPLCPPGFISEMQRTFVACRLAYTIDARRPPRILPAATREEGSAIVEAIKTLGQAGFDGSAAHLRSASACINRGDWAGGVRESIHAVESVARQVDPKAGKTLGSALKTLERHGVLHPALGDAFSKLYGYASDRPGIRHALLDRTDAAVGQDEAVFMLGTCASFASYLRRKYAIGEFR